jgi:hypothetical protein
MKNSGFCTPVWSLLVLTILAVMACNQDPIFYIISQETAPRDPRIEGAPTNLVVFKRESQPILYVASGRLHWYARPKDVPDGAPSWDSGSHSIPQPGGKIKGLAATKNHLYALCLNGTGIATTLKRIGENGNITANQQWETINVTSGEPYPLLQSIYADPDSEILFVGSRTHNTTIKNNTYAVLYIKDDAVTLQNLISGVELLSGTVKSGSDYFLNTAGSGIWGMTQAGFDADPPASPVQLEDAADSTAAKNRWFMGMLRMEDDTIIAAERGGILYKMINDGSVFKFEALKKSDGAAIVIGTYATGALALWQHPDGGPKLLLAGRNPLSSTSYAYGYVEFELDDNGALFPDSTARHDAGKLVTVSNNDQYATNLGKHPINHLFQTPSNIDTGKTLFAATQLNGLWSCRSYEWNAEE